MELYRREKNNSFTPVSYPEILQATDLNLAEREVLCMIINLEIPGFIVAFQPQAIIKIAKANITKFGLCCDIYWKASDEEIDEKNYIHWFIIESTNKKQALYAMNTIEKIINGFIEAKK